MSGRPGAGEGPSGLGVAEAGGVLQGVTQTLMETQPFPHSWLCPTLLLPLPLTALSPIFFTHLFGKQVSLSLSNYWAFSYTNYDLILDDLK